MYLLVVVVRKVIGVDADVVRLRVGEEAYGFDIAEPFEKRFADSMHAIHNTAVVGENDGIAEVAVAYETGMLGDLSAGDRLRSVSSPVRLVEFADGGEWNALSRQGGRGLDETVDVPS
jgi:hypothetical protein